MKKVISAGIIAAAGFFLRFAARYLHGFADAYAAILNPFWVNTLGRFSGLLPFSFVEILIYAFLLFMIFLLVRLVIGLFRRKKNLKKKILRFFLSMVLLASIIFFLFEANEDIYFYRTSFASRYDYGTGSYSTEELTAVCRKLAQEANAECTQVERRSDGIMINSDGIGARVSRAMETLGKIYPELRGWYPQAKGLFSSVLMSLTGMSGIYSAYTIEANYDKDMPGYNFAFTMSHELSHLKGVLPENEANFVAYLNCMNSEDADIRYSGALLGWIYCGNELYKRDRTSWKAIAETLDASVNADLNDNNQFWNSYKGKASEAAKNFNDSYLKGEGVEEGALSYDRVVDLIVSYEISK